MYTHAQTSERRLKIFSDMHFRMLLYKNLKQKNEYKQAPFKYLPGLFSAVAFFGIT